MSDFLFDKKDKIELDVIISLFLIAESHYFGEALLSEIIS
jgi:hypothetical protein